MAQSPRSDDYDFMKELEKQIAKNNSSSDPALGEERPPAKEADQISITARMDFHAIPNFFTDVIMNDAHAWGKIAGYCTIALSSDIAINTISLEYLASTNLQIGVDIIRNKLYDAISRHRAIGVQAPENIDGDTGQLVVNGLRGVSEAYLSTIHLSSIKLLCLPDPIVSESRFYNIFALLHPEAYVDPHSLDEVIEATTWDPRFGYRFWHDWPVPGQERITWFANGATRHILWHAIRNAAGQLLITPQELALHPAHRGDIMLFNASALHAVNKICFVLAWIVVQMRTLVEAHRSGYTNYVPLPLRPAVIARVAHERSVIAGFFNWLWLQQDDNEARWKAFEQWILLNPVPHQSAIE